MSRTPSIAVVTEGGLVQAVVLQDWPGQIPQPRIVVVDYDTEEAHETEITRFPIGDGIAEAVCRGETPVIYEDVMNALSPVAVLAAMGDDPAGQPPASMTVT